MIPPASTSRLLRVPIVRDHGSRDVYDIRTPLPFRPVAGMREITLRASDTMHTLAFEFYGDAQLWWAIADFNGIFDPTTELAAGRMVVIPPIDYVDAYLTRPA